MEKKVYVLIDEGCYDFESFVSVKVYASLNLAKEVFTCYREQLMADWIDGGNWEVMDDDELSFEIGKEGDYAVNHASLRIEGQVVRTK